MIQPTVIAFLNTIEGLGRSAEQDQGPPSPWRARPRRLLTVVTKSNAMVMWDEIAAAVAGEFPT